MIFKTIEKISSKNIKVLWETDHYDGIIAGIIRYDNKIYYMDSWDLDMGGWDTPSDYELKEIKETLETKKLKIIKRNEGDSDEVQIFEYNGMEVIYEPNEEEDCKFSIGRPRKFYIYEIALIDKIREYLAHFLFLFLVRRDFLGHIGYSAYYKFISIHRFMKRKEYDTYSKHRCKYHKNKIIGWTED